MKLFIFLLLLAGAYTFGLLKTTNLILGQLQHINTTYQYVANNSEGIANGKAIPTSVIYGH